MDMQVIVPEEGLKKALVVGCKTWMNKEQAITTALEEFCRWLSTSNHVAPTVEEAHAIWEAKKDFTFEPYEWVRWGASEWLRRMFLGPKLKCILEDLEVSRREFLAELGRHSTEPVMCASCPVHPKGHKWEDLRPELFSPEVLLKYLTRNDVNDGLKILAIKLFQIAQQR